MDSQYHAISDGHRTEVNLWLEMVGWPTYLQAYQYHRSKLLTLLKIPPTDPDRSLNGPLGRARLKKRRIK